MTYGHLRAYCLYTGSAPGPTLGIEYGKAFTFTGVPLDSHEMEMHNSFTWEWERELSGTVIVHKTSHVVAFVHDVYLFSNI